MYNFNVMHSATQIIWFKFKYSIEMYNFNVMHSATQIIWFKFKYSSLDILN